MRMTESEANLIFWLVGKVKQFKKLASSLCFLRREQASIENDEVSCLFWIFVNFERILFRLKSCARDLIMRVPAS